MLNEPHSIVVGWLDPVWMTLVVWLFMTGSVIGSFLNVVAYRLPLGMRLASPPSRCPECLAAVRRRDNIPILGWFLVGGRCRDCHAPISPRYPLVELVTAILFAWLALVGPLDHSANLPYHDLQPVPTRVASMLTRIEPWVTYVYHIVLACGLLSAALMAIDGHATPRRLALFVLLVGLIVPPFVDDVRPVHSGFEAVIPPSWPAWSTTAIDSICGLAFGCMVGWLAPVARPALATAVPAWPSQRVAAAWIGVFLGWQAAAALAATAAVLCAPLNWMIGQRSRTGDIPWVAVLAVLAPAWIAAWSTVTTRLPGVGDRADALTAALAAACVAAASFWTWTPRITGRRR